MEKGVGVVGINHLLFPDLRLQDEVLAPFGVFVWLLTNKGSARVTVRYVDSTASQKHRVARGKL